MLVSFELTMPNKASWNGRWSGEGKKYFVIKSLSARFINSKEHLHFLNTDKPYDSFYYRWDDGWGADVLVDKVDAAEAKKRRKMSAGFCGYDWMITSIIQNGVIETRTIAV